MPELLIGLGMLAAAGAVLWQTLAIPVSPLYSKVGPTVFPYITTGGMFVLAVLLIKAAVQGGWQPDDEKETPTDWKSMAFVVAGLVANMLLIGPLGFTAASVIMFVLVCYGFGSRHPLRDLGDRFARRRVVESRPARSVLRRLAQVELPAPVGRYATARYSLVACRPRTGRQHQVRRHLKHLRHPVIGDANYGDGAHNRFFRSRGVSRMLLAASGLRFIHPFSAAPFWLSAPLEDSFAEVLRWPEWVAASVAPA